MKGQCKSRILYALRFRLMTERELATELFVCATDIRTNASQMVNDGLLHRKLRHSKTAGRPVWHYSSVAFPPRYAATPGGESIVGSMVGDWDMIQRITR